MTLPSPAELLDEDVAALYFDVITACTVPCVE